MAEARLLEPEAPLLQPLWSAVPLLQPLWPAVPPSRANEQAAHPAARRRALRVQLWLRVPLRVTLPSAPLLLL